MPENTDQTPENGSVEPVDERTGTPEGNDTGENPKGNREARYRTERNDARAERDALAQRVERFQRNELERIASAHLASPADLLTLSGNELVDYINAETGDIDPDKVNADAAVILAERPGLRKLQPAVDYSQGSGYGTPGKGTPSWDSLLK